MTAPAASVKRSGLPYWVVLATAPAVVLTLTVLAAVLRATGSTPGIIAGDVAALAAVAAGGWLRFRQALRDIVRRKITVNVFLALAITASVSIGEFVPAAVIVFIMSVAGALEAYVNARTRDALEGVLSLVPETATRLEGSEETEVPVSQLVVGDLVLVRTGERLPVDGEVVEGQASVNQAPVTGESMPDDKEPGSEVFTGSLCEVGSLVVRATRVGSETTLARVVKLVNEAKERRAPIAQIADRFTAWFLPAVLAIAIATWALTGDPVRAVAVLLVACPCALAIATPSAVTAGMANLARHGVLVKGGDTFEVARHISVVALDKTGTTTVGRPRVAELAALNGYDDDRLLALAASVERRSEHPLAKAVLAAAHERHIPLQPVANHQVDIAHGVSGDVDGHRVIVGNARQLKRLGIDTDQALHALLNRHHEAGLTGLVVTVDGQPAGVLALADEVRDDVPRAVDVLRGEGVEEVVLLTGDRPGPAKRAAEAIGADGHRADLLPEDKVTAVRALAADGRKVAVVGDGINDAPALAEATVGIAMGVAGTDVAMEAADIGLMQDDLAKVADTIHLSRRIARRIKVNILLSMIYNAVGITLSSLGYLNPIPATIYQELGCISVVLSSTLLLAIDPAAYRTRRPA